MSVCLSVVFSVIIGQELIVNNYGLTGGETTEVFFLKHRKRASKKFMNCIPDPWLSLNRIKPPVYLKS